MDFILNGEHRDFQGNPDGTLLDYLREHEGIITAKKGCNDEAACGCCAVQVMHEVGYNASIQDHYD